MQSQAYCSRTQHLVKPKWCCLQRKPLHLWTCLQGDRGNDLLQVLLGMHRAQWLGSPETTSITCASNLVRWQGVTGLLLGTQWVPNPKQCPCEVFWACPALSWSSLLPTQETCPSQHHLCAADGCLHLGLGGNVSSKPQSCRLWSSSLYCVGFGGLWALGKIWHCGAGSQKMARLVLLQPKDQSFRDQLSQLSTFRYCPNSFWILHQMDLEHPLGLKHWQHTNSGLAQISAYGATKCWNSTSVQIRETKQAA